MQRHILKEKKKKLKMKKKLPFSQVKAKKILSEKNPTLRGKPISKGQRGLLGLIAGGKSPRLLS